MQRDRYLSAGRIRREDEEHGLDASLSRLGRRPLTAGEAETEWVFPEKFFDELPAVLNGRAAAAGRRSALRAGARRPRGRTKPIPN